MTNDRTERQNQGVEDGWVCVGTLGTSHGVRGDIRLKSFTDIEAAIFDFGDLRRGPDGPKVSLKKLRANKDGFIVRVGGVETREDAAAMKGAKLFVARDVLDDTEDEDEFYLADLIGLRAEDLSGSEIGFVRAIENFGSEDLVELVLNEPVKGLGRYAFIPFRKVYVPTIDLAGGKLAVDFETWHATQESAGDAGGGPSAEA